MPKKQPLALAKRERQLVEIVYRLGEASVAEVRAEVPDPPSYSAIRAILGLLVEKRVLKQRRDGKRYLYRPSTPIEQASRSALKNLVSTFFDGQPTDAIAALLDISSKKLTEDDFHKMRQVIDKAAKEKSP